MRLDHGIFFICELCLTVDNGIRHANLSNVMQKSHVIYVFTVLFGKSKLLRQHSGIFRNAHGMTSGIFILGIDGVRQRLHDFNGKCLDLIVGIDIPDDDVEGPNKEEHDQNGKETKQDQSRRISTTIHQYY